MKIIRDSRLTIRMRSGESALIRAAAHRCAQPFSEFTRSAALFQARKVLGVTEPAELAGIAPLDVEPSQGAA